MAAGAMQQEEIGFDEFIIWDGEQCYGALCNQDLQHSSCCMGLAHHHHLLLLLLLMHDMHCRPDHLWHHNAYQESHIVLDAHRIAASHSSAVDMALLHATC